MSDPEFEAFIAEFNRRSEEARPMDVSGMSIRDLHYHVCGYGPHKPVSMSDIFRTQFDAAMVNIVNAQSSHVGTEPNGANEC